MMCTAKISIVALIAVYSVSGGPVQNVFIDGFKDPICYRWPEFSDRCPNYDRPNTKGHHPVRWYFSSLFGSCVPLWMPVGEDICPQNDMFTKTKRECEDLCGTPCTVFRLDGHTETGVCMLPGYCNYPQGDMAESVFCFPMDPTMKCCPVDYELSPGDQHYAEAHNESP